MKKRILAIFLAVFAAAGMTACGGEEVATQEVDYDMTFETRQASMFPNWRSVMRKMQNGWKFLWKAENGKTAIRSLFP
ncbi:MAG: hypothetical protein II993_02910 [Anaerotignum sp.]|nr:hypothetical protein [Anaerotignum sp.]